MSAKKTMTISIQLQFRSHKQGFVLWQMVDIKQLLLFLLIGAYSNICNKFAINAIDERVRLIERVIGWQLTGSYVIDHSKPDDEPS